MTGSAATLHPPFFRKSPIRELRQNAVAPAIIGNVALEADEADDSLRLLTENYVETVAYQLSQFQEAANTLQKVFGAHQWLALVAGILNPPVLANMQSTLPAFLFASSLGHSLVPWAPATNVGRPSSQLAQTIRGLDLTPVASDPDAMDVARRAITEAAAFADHYLPDTVASVHLSDDGVVTLQWRAPDRGVLVAFMGDGTGVLSVKVPGGNYASAGREIDLSKGLPAAALAAIEEISGAR